LQVLPKESKYHRIIREVLDWHRQYPQDWKANWQNLENKWNKDRCPWGAKSKFNISASLNGAYIALGLLYGEKDFMQTIEIATRCGQDSDCNPANAGGILGAMLGFKNLPERVIADMKPYLETKFNYTPFSIESASQECLRLALENIAANGGKVAGDQVRIRAQKFKATGPAEVAFPTLESINRFEATDERLFWNGKWTLAPDEEEPMRYSSTPDDRMEIEFTGNAIFVQGDARFDKGILEYLIDGKSIGTRDMYLPKQWRNAKQSTAVWLTDLPDGRHKLHVRVTGRKHAESEGIEIGLERVVIYRGQIAR
ncbi:MAG: ADP-ribosylglycohydrolase family protein, partial [bacterium]